MKTNKPKILTTEEIKKKHGPLTDILAGYSDYQKENSDRIKIFVDKTSIMTDLKKVFLKNAIEVDDQNIGIKIAPKTGVLFESIWQRSLGSVDVMVETLAPKIASDISEEFCFFMYLLSLDPDARVRYSGMRIARRKELLTMYLQRLDILLDDANFLAAIELDSATLFEKRDEFAKDLENLKLGYKRASQIKLLEIPLFPIYGKLDLLGYTDHKKGRILADLIRDFDLPQYRAQTINGLAKTVSKWFDARLD